MRTRFRPTEKTRVRRPAKRAAYDRTTVLTILDEGLVGHVGFCMDGEPCVLPMLYARVGETLYLHGSIGNRMLRALAAGAPACVEVTLLDGLVLARSAFHHSMNYRSVVIFGRGAEVTDAREKARAFQALSDQALPGRWQAARRPNARELAQTLVVSLPLSRCSAKVRAGPPSDEAADYALDAWAGVLPIRREFGIPEDDPKLKPGVPVPEHVRSPRRRAA